MRLIFAGAAVTSILISLLIVASLAGEAWSFLRSIDLSSLWDLGWFPRRDMFDIKTVLTGTLLIALIAMVVATPLGLGAAIYLSEYARPRARRWLKPILEVLAGIPSVVLGYFALTWISPNLVMRLNPHAGVFSMAAAGIGVGILVTPLVASVTEDAMRAVPQALREASYGLGAKKATHRDPGGVPRRRLRHRRLAHPRPLPGHWGDHGGGHGRRGGGRLAVRVERLRAGADHDRRHDRPGHRLRPGGRIDTTPSRACSSWACCSS